ncbi:MAG: hypothetical protein HC904_12010 [Blastochloris sp.]|nr:hypothetical protein [Blastochloris sp.]
MNEWITLSLKRTDVGQILDGLEVRHNQWRDTADYLRTGISPHPDFIAEEANDESEAQALADWYGRIIQTIRKQRDLQKSLDSHSENFPVLPNGEPLSCFCIFINTFFQGDVPVERNETDNFVVYETREAAEREIAAFAIDRLHEYLAGERDFDDAIHSDEFVVHVHLNSDGSISDKTGRIFQQKNW